MITQEQKKQFTDIIVELSDNLNITETEYNIAVSSYKAVGNQLAKEGSRLEKYRPEILPQGSFLLGTVIKPINPIDDVDIDLVCQLRSDNVNMTQRELKQIVGDQIKENKTYEKLLQNPDGRRCWTLNYRSKSDDRTDKYHMDILPSVVDTNYGGLLNASFENFNVKNLDNLSIRITDKERQDYSTEKRQLNWLKSNPFGYAMWFYNRASLDSKIVRNMLTEKIQKVPSYQKDKLNLQLVIQILKRHRDVMFQDKKYNDDKPISIIITTLASKAYRNESNLMEALTNIILGMHKFIETITDPLTGKTIKVITNPINEEENFADKWIEHPIREEYFYKWLTKLKEDFGAIWESRGMDSIKENLSNALGEDLVTKTFTNYGRTLLTQRENGTIKMAASSGILSEFGKVKVPQHQPYGKKEQ